MRSIDEWISDTRREKCVEGRVIKKNTFAPMQILPRLVFQYLAPILKDKCGWFIRCIPRKNSKHKAWSIIPPEGKPCQRMQSGIELLAYFENKSSWKWGDIEKSVSSWILELKGIVAHKHASLVDHYLFTEKEQKKHDEEVFKESLVNFERCCGVKNLLLRALEEAKLRPSDRWILETKKIKKPRNNESTTRLPPGNLTPCSTNRTIKNSTPQINTLPRSLLPKGDVTPKLKHAASPKSSFFGSKSKSKTPVVQKKDSDEERKKKSPQRSPRRTDMKSDPETKLKPTKLTKWLKKAPLQICSMIEDNDESESENDTVEKKSITWIKQDSINKSFRNISSTEHKRVIECGSSILELFNISAMSSVNEVPENSSPNELIQDCKCGSAILEWELSKVTVEELKQPKDTKIKISVNL